MTSDAVRAPGIRLFLAGLVLAVTLPFVGLLLADARREQRIRIELLQAQAGAAAEAAASAVDQTFRLGQRTLLNVLERYGAGFGAHPDCHAELGKLLEVVPRAQNLVFTDPDGVVICSAVPLPPGRTVSHGGFPDFRTAVGERRLVVWEPRTGAVTGRPIIGMSLPLYADARLLGTLGIGLDAGTLGELVIERVPAQGIAALLSATGVVAARSANAEAWLGKPTGDTPLGRALLDEGRSTFEAPDLDGVPRLYSAARVPSADWHVVVGIERAAALAPVEAAIRRQLALAALIAGVGLGVAAWMSGLFGRRMRQVSEAMRRAAGGADVRVAPAGPRELGVMAHAFNDMTAARAAAEHALRGSELRYRTMFEAFPVPAWVTDEATYRFLDVNPAAVARYGWSRDEFLAMTLFDIRPAAERDRLRAEAAVVLVGTDMGEWTHLTASGETLRAEVHATRIDWSGRPARLSLCIDATERIVATERLADRERLLTALFAHMPSVFALRDRDGRYVLVNEEWERTTGVRAADVIGHRAVGRLPEAIAGSTDAAADATLRAATVQSREVSFETAQGTRRYISTRFPLFDAEGRVAFVGVIATDITERVEAERRLAESAARLEALSRRLLDIQEDERRAVARELHDEVGQVLTALKLNMQAIARGSLDAAGAERVADALALLERAIADVRHLAVTLRPTALDDLGLVPALRTWLRAQSARSGVAIAAHLPDQPVRVDGAIETACFRIVQEAVTNALRHAAPERIDVRLMLDGEVVLEVEDNGGGFDADSARRRSNAGGSTGLSSMAERAALAGGTLHIRSQAGSITIVRAEFPAPRP